MSNPDFLWKPTDAERDRMVVAISGTSLEAARDAYENVTGEVATNLGLRHAIRAYLSSTLESKAARDVLAERERQKSVEGWTPEHDDEHSSGELTQAALNYAAAAAISIRLNASGFDQSQKPPFNGWMNFDWPWEDGWWKPGDKRRMLVKAGALILAEIERLDRA